MRSETIQLSILVYWKVCGEEVCMSGNSEELIVQLSHGESDG